MTTTDLHLSAPWRTAHDQRGRIVAQVNDDLFEFDFAICASQQRFAIAGTGYFVDPAARPEFADFAHLYTTLNLSN
ncbi:hypothetical protein SAMD00079811_77560 (plasmid) [Scytonema sp. HK-05]|uniref:hypothetical protein n=1 Tax=Scytonema sp. HK-05 TaxID=1137095 RepID=UPI0009368AE7|nr:hypothetical protein [Scytonema sp. HK-05]OKH59444.1 hypothetical protein NIES2130_08985 [Scytonema sp. HK-05]BAY50127.1 hypothetical protein SAMD00079811_77560 [Scytonema sp. HK-05]